MRIWLAAIFLVGPVDSLEFGFHSIVTHAAEPGRIGNCSSQELTSFLKALLEEKPHRLRSHPDLVTGNELNQGLRIGETIYLDLIGDSLKSKISTRHTADSVKATVVSVNKDGPLNYRLRLQDDGKEITIPVADLYGNVYHHPNFRQNAPYKHGEWVIIGNDGAPNIIGEDIKDPSRKIKIGPPYLAKFIGPDGVDHYHVQIEHRLYGVSEVVRVRSYDIMGAPIGTELAAKALIERTKEIKFELSLGERVRFRGSDGTMQMGLLESFIDAKQARVRTANGMNVHVDRSQVFRTVSFELPRTPRTDGRNYFLEYKGPRFTLDRPTGLVRDFLDGAARISSAQDFMGKSALQKLETLQAYLLTFVKYENWAANAEIMGPKNYHELICTGGGVCRHQVDLLASIYSEAGLRVRRISNRAYSRPEDSHTWLEVDMIERGKMITFVVDPANQVVKPLEESVIRSVYYPNSLDADLWSNPRRAMEYYDAH